MLLQSFTSSYLQYKSDTHAVASWLATTAARYGYPTDLLRGSDNDKKPDTRKEHKPSQRLKGKARKQAREASLRTNGVNSNQQTTPQQQKLPTYIIAIKDFTTLAEYIAGKINHPAKVPGSFITVLNRAISVRHEHGLQIASQLPDNPESNVANDSHDYFIGILERVRDVLQPLMTREETATNTTGEEQSTDIKHKLANRFENLDVQEPSEDFLRAPDVAPSTKSRVESDTNYESEQLQGRREALISFILLIEDFNQLRGVIMQTWTGYKMGIISLVTASITTNTALDIARSMEEEMKQLLDKHGGSEKLLALCYVGLCKTKGEDPNFRELPGDDTNFRVYEKTNDIYWHTYTLLRELVARVDSQDIPLYNPSGDRYDPTSDRSTMTAREKFQEDQNILLEVLPEFCYLCLGTERSTTEDELTRGLREILISRKIPYWVVLATHVLLDIHHILRDEIDRGFEAVIRITGVLQSNIEAALNFTKSIRPARTWSEQHDEVLRSLQADINFFKNDQIQQAKVKVGRPAGQSFLLQKWHPLYCGMWAYTIQGAYQEIGIMFVGAWGSALCTYHLYNAMRQEKLLHNRWEDMELFKKIHGPQIFPGGPPKTPEDYFKRFALSVGYSATLFAPDRRSNAIQEVSKKGPKSIVSPTPVFEMFKPRFVYGQGQIGLTQQDVNKILTQSKWMEAQDPEDCKDSKEGKRFLVQTNTSVKRKTGLKVQQPQPSAVELLRSLRVALQVEYVDFSFDYFVFHKVCWTTLHRIADACKEGLNSMLGVGWMKKETDLPCLVWSIFTDAKDTDKLAGLLIKKKDEKVTGQLLLEAAAACDDALVDDGFGAMNWNILTKQYGIPNELIG